MADQERTFVLGRAERPAKTGAAGSLVLRRMLFDANASDPEKALASFLMVIDPAQLPANEILQLS